MNQIILKTYYPSRNWYIYKNWKIYIAFGFAFLSCSVLSSLPGLFLRKYFDVHNVLLVILMYIEPLVLFHVSLFWLLIKPIMAKKEYRKVKYILTKKCHLIIEHPKKRMELDLSSIKGLLVYKHTKSTYSIIFDSDFIGGFWWYIGKYDSILNKVKYLPPAVLFIDSIEEVLGVIKGCNPDVKIKEKRTYV